ncbi:hypothetical protein [Aneurinibacillus migulanus]|uniref:Uncharacterized protein n=1 Tax=Aneurinibacillus migulanus TaxID=47500 RepID=A0A0D1XED5_ANEMI|nr:hypothetical protein [Aneurinibacillus migulanus]KIV52771.1 hypothetical protein TS65_21770 [Aneurinibacillus migulanus]KON95038.1 hypothetical protein AF333_05625 [Aneurinibacillus migulanus]MED0896523.1 acetyl-CoA acetyltransferase [Aneurinibacillus migulanus]MED1614938.1 acetyl-CoA acetyltransferase [Aneurinibacillus migulanus]MED4731721.1 acetyl-CoA acetyltransferase [Aneurinibacillus migulanus]
MNRRIERLRRRAAALLGRRVDVELFNDRDIEGILVLVRRNFIVLRVRRRGRIIRIRIPFTRIEDIDLD